ncbi:hypothetical protein [Bacillus solitudinis]|uniref:hypothetical protein n=1 Tax=Bacillus solitudinis TaxID=2014074 RepID=UPI0012FD2B95|nr:hypothetical protein [Bacillus solitudinis]
MAIKLRVKEGSSKVKKTELSRGRKVTHLSEKSTSRMSHNVQKLNNKVMKYINNQ